MKESKALDNQETKTVNVSDLNLNNFHGFHERYNKHLATSKTQVEAYEKTENDYFQIFGKRKYSGYNSFRNIRNKSFKVR